MLTKTATTKENDCRRVRCKLGTYIRQERTLGQIRPREPDPPLEENRKGNEWTFYSSSAQRTLLASNSSFGECDLTLPTGQSMRKLRQRHSCNRDADDDDVVVVVAIDSLHRDSCKLTERQASSPISRNKVSCVIQLARPNTLSFVICSMQAEPGKESE